jgi:APA family basic amino acid/polyamine antiporter
LRNAIGFSSFGVLLYYAIANASAYTQPPSQRRWPRPLNVAGFLGCTVLVATLPLSAVVAGIGVLGVGVMGRVVVFRLRPDQMASQAAEARGTHTSGEHCRR